MAVAVDAVSSAVSITGSGQTSATHTNLTVGAGLSNGGLIVGVVWDQTTIASPSAHWDSTGTNQAMTLLGTGIINGGAVSVALFGLRNPTSGNKTLSITWTTAGQATIFGISFTGVNQTSDAAAFKNFTSNSAATTTPSLTVTSAIGDMVAAIFGVNSQTFTSVNNTQLFINNSGAFRNSAMNRAAGASPNVAMSAVLSAGSQTVAFAAIDIGAAPAAAPQSTLPSMHVG